MGRMSGHPNIVDLYQVGVTGRGRPYLVMPYHAHGSLDARIRRSGPVGWAQALRLGIKIAGALETAHCVGTLHRDVKPANILLTDYDEPQLTDFGIARIAGGFETTTGAITGSPAFTAPEVLEGRPPTVASDVYSLGSTLFCALTGHAAFERHSGEQVVAQFLRISRQQVPDLRESGIPDDVCAAVERPCPAPWRSARPAPPNSGTSFVKWNDATASPSTTCTFPLFASAITSPRNWGRPRPHRRDRRLRCRAEMSGNPRPLHRPR
jgi:serine/threonine-protein kinase PknK